MGFFFGSSFLFCSSEVSSDLKKKKSRCSSKTAGYQLQCLMKKKKKGWIRVGLEVFINKSRLAVLSSFPGDQSQRRCFQKRYLVVSVLAQFSFCGYRTFFRDVADVHQT